MENILRGQVKLLATNLASLTSFPPSWPPLRLTRNMQLHKRVLQKRQNHSEMENVLKAGYVLRKMEGGRNMPAVAAAVGHVKMFRQKSETKMLSCSPDMNVQCQ